MTEEIRRRALLGAALSIAACARNQDAGGRAHAGSAHAGPEQAGALAHEGANAQEESAMTTLSSSSVSNASGVPHRPLGRTGATVSIVGIGGSHLGDAGETEGIRIVRSALDRGVNFLDNCWDYHGGRSEEIMGKALADGYRQRAFLMTKLDGRTKTAARDQLEQSLRRLKTDVIDLVQIHEVIRASDPARCFAPGGAIEALVEAKAKGKLRFVGFTGHKDPDIHLAMLAAADAHGFAFDTVQMPLNVMDAHYKSFGAKVLPVANGKGMGVLGMKSMANGKILESGVVSAVECLHYAMNLPVSVVITGCDRMRILDQAIEAAQSFRAMSPEEVSALLARTEAPARDGRYEEFKTTRRYDGTSQHPQWLERAEI
jgi:predicted aldo/keto reductase-like oxidoreductase